MANLKKKNYLHFLFILSFTILASAYAIEYILGYQPCNLCLIERIPYALSIIILILNFKFKNDQIFFSVLLLLVFSFSFLISLYHLGIEQDLIVETSVCGYNGVDLITKEKVLESLQEIRISCKDVTFKIFGLSLTTYNMLISILMFLTSVKIYLINNDIKKKN
ncbi:disulfide bond formation protein B [Candidatus Pelagibacter sp.]|nr:disulfide bond formation protein B [Candidatus Pelagibacter sp.]